MEKLTYLMLTKKLLNSKINLMVFIKKLEVTIMKRWFFQRSEIECKNMGEDFLDEADAIDYLYYGDKDKSSVIYKVVLDIVKNLMVVISDFS